MFNSVFSLDLKQRQPSMESKGCKNQCSNNCPQVLQVMQIKPPSFQAGKEYIAMWLAVRVIPLLEKKPYLVVIRFICHDNFLWSNTRQSQEAQSHILPDLNSCGSKTQMVDTSQKIVQKKICFSRSIFNPSQSPEKSDCAFNPCVNTAQVSRIV